MNIIFKWQYHYCLIIAVFFTKVRTSGSDSIIQQFNSNTSETNNIVHNVQFNYTSDEEMIEIQIENEAANSLCQQYF